LASLHLLHRRQPEDAAQPLRRQDGGVLSTPLHVPVHGALLRGKETAVPSHGTRLAVGAALCVQQDDVLVFITSSIFSSSSLFQMGRCDGCRKQGYMAEKLQCLGSVRNFCHLPCLLQYCFLHFETSQPPASSNGAGTAPQTPFGKLRSRIAVTP